MYKIFKVCVKLRRFSIPPLYQKLDFEPERLLMDVDVLMNELGYK